MDLAYSCDIMSRSVSLQHSAGVPFMSAADMVSLKSFDPVESRKKHTEKGKMTEARWLETSRRLRLVCQVLSSSRQLGF